MKTIMLPGLGETSRHIAAQLAICDAAGADELVEPAKLTRGLKKDFTEKEIRQAIFTLTRAGVLKKSGVGAYTWTFSG